MMLHQIVSFNGFCSVKSRPFQTSLPILTIVLVNLKLFIISIGGNLVSILIYKLHKIHKIGHFNEFKVCLLTNNVWNLFFERFKRLSVF